MKERVGQTLGRKEARGLMISTFHTLGLDIIKREYAALGMKANFSLFDDTDQLALLKELTEGLIEDDKVLLQQLISTISNWKNDLKTPAQAAAEAKGERDRIFAHCYGLYDAHLKACNVLDFDDLILCQRCCCNAMKKSASAGRTKFATCWWMSIRTPTPASMNW